MHAEDLTVYLHGLVYACINVIVLLYPSSGLYWPLPLKVGGGSYSEIGVGYDNLELVPHQLLARDLKKY